MKTQGYDAGIHVGVSQSDPEMIQIRFFEQPGIQMTTALEKEVEKHFNRRELRRVPFGDIGNVTYPARVREEYAQDLLSTLDVDAIRGAHFRIVVDYGYSASSFVLPLVLGPLGTRGGLRARVHDRGGRDGVRRCASRSGRRSGSSARSAPTSARSSTGRASGSSSSTSRAARSPSSRRCSCSSA